MTSATGEPPSIADDLGIATPVFEAMPSATEELPRIPDQTFNISVTANAPAQIAERCVSLTRINLLLLLTEVEIFTLKNGAHRILLSY